jgi:hypothetical protein
MLPFAHSVFSRPHILLFPFAIRARRGKLRATACETACKHASVCVYESGPRSVIRVAGRECVREEVLPISLEVLVMLNVDQPVSRRSTIR